ncbi:hypothetical protein PVAG01_05120 [Phlyctema vagabunda]|uniref:Uncharacterized protein n=1 Tax=Phlyctema vagabunda TaxID=108571 RepID=A0ABR4PJ74_9HELO
MHLVFSCRSFPRHYSPLLKAKTQQQGRAWAGRHVNNAALRPLCATEMTRNRYDPFATTGDLEGHGTYLRK